MSTTQGTTNKVYFFIKPRTRVMHLLTNDDFLLKSSVEAIDERREDLGEADGCWSLRESPSNLLPSSSYSSSAIGLLSQGMLLSLRLGGRGSLVCCVCDCSDGWLCCCCRYCSHELTTSVAVSGSIDAAALLVSRPVSKLREREGGSARRCGRGKRGEPAPRPLPTTPRAVARSAGLTARPPRLMGEAERGLLVANNL